MGKKVKNENAIIFETIGKSMKSLANQFCINKKVPRQLRPLF